MQLLTSLRDWLLEMRAQKLRTLSTVLGIAWGTFGVVGIMAFGRGLEDVMRLKAEGLGPGVVVVWGQRTTREFAGYGAGRQVLITDEDVSALEQQIPELASISSEYIRGYNVQHGDRLHNVTISGVLPSYAALRNMTPLPGGRFLDARDTDEGRAVIFLGDEVRRHLFGNEEAVGRTLSIAGTPFTVVGVLRPKLQDSNYEGQDADRVCIPAPTFRRVFGDRYADYVVSSARDALATSTAKRRVYEVLGRRLKFDPSDEDVLGVMDATEGAKIRETAFLAMDVLITMACALTLLVGGIGVGNLMFLVVRRRTREIGIRMAFGAKPRWILQETLVQALLLVAVGGAAGFFAAWGLSALIGMTPATEFLGHPRISLRTAGGTVGMLAIIGLLAGWFPARRAARLDPVRALAD